MGVCSKYSCSEWPSSALLDIELGQCGHEVHACFGRCEGFGLLTKKVVYPCRQCKLKSGKGVRGILHGYGFGFRS